MTRRKMRRKRKWRTRRWRTRTRRAGSGGGERMQSKPATKDSQNLGPIMPPHPPLLEKQWQGLSLLSSQGVPPGLLKPEPAHLEQQMNMLSVLRAYSTENLAAFNGLGNGSNNTSGIKRPDMPASGLEERCFKVAHFISMLLRRGGALCRGHTHLSCSAAAWDSPAAPGLMTPPAIRAIVNLLQETSGNDQGPNGVMFLKHRCSVREILDALVGK
ncbi:hypothetical protein SKAU_G00181850 [Synaphobranchus kaupii]|uniref:Uncharacterized protein n=1 Tax=Synaphobranchus kaupii TaxID=118154 RepID=A0A9Q1IW07_SYNKA|nr:hypothetical protein SKAU_G00181850 [Synaphobranchus kaupii]